MLLASLSFDEEECRPLFSYQARAFDLFASHDRSPLSNENANVTATPNRTIHNTYAMEVLTAEWGPYAYSSRRDTEADAELAQVRVRHFHPLPVYQKLLQPSLLFNALPVTCRSTHFGITLDCSRCSSRAVVAPDKSAFGPRIFAVTG
jgi:hypothetical protein